MLSKAAFNALLKTLEEPPAHAIFILATTEVHKIPATVLSRCQRHEFRRISVAEIVSTLEEMAENEQIQITPEALTLIARQSTGSLRDAISLLDQLASTGGQINLQFAQSVIGTATSQAVIDVVAALLDCDSADGLNHIHQALDSGSDAKQFARQVVDYLRSLLLIQIGDVETSDVTPEMQSQIKDHSKAIDTPDLLRVIRLFNQAAYDSRGTWQPALPLEVAFIEACQGQSDSPPPPAQDKSTSSNPPPPQPQKTPSTAEEQSRPDRSTAASPSAPSIPGDRLSQSLAQEWPHALSMVRDERPNLYGLLNSSQSRHLSGSVLILGFASDILKNQAAKRENLEIIKRVFSQVLGTEIDVRCAITAAKNNDIPTDVDDDGMVASALRDMGGEIVDIQ
jgi:DNA polymerase-3 subunit gamma/tau